MFGDKDPLTLSQTPGFSGPIVGGHVPDAPPPPPPAEITVVPGAVPAATRVETPSIPASPAVMPFGDNNAQISSLTPSTMEFRKGPFDKKPEEPVMQPVTTPPVVDTITKSSPMSVMEPTTEATFPAPVVTEALPVNSREGLNEILTTVKEGLDNLNAGIQAQTSQLQEINNTLKTLTAPKTKTETDTETPLQSKAPQSATPQPKSPQSATGAIEGYTIGPAKPVPTAPVVSTSTNTAPGNKIA